MTPSVGWNGDVTANGSDLAGPGSVDGGLSAIGQRWTADLTNSAPATALLARVGVTCILASP